VLKDERIGKFEIGADYIEEPAKRASLFKLSSYMILLRAESMFYKNAIEYVAISPLFEVWHEGEIVPEYEILFDHGQIHAIRKNLSKAARLMSLDPRASGD
jgi:hypothetical protein